MKIVEFSPNRRDDAEIFASIQGLVPHHHKDKTVLEERVKEDEFNEEEVFKSSYSRMVSKSFRIRSTTLYKILQQSARTLETRNEILRRLLIPSIRKEIDSTRDMADKEKMELVLYALEEWGEEAHDRFEEIDAGLIKNGYRESLCQPLVCTHVHGNRLPEDLRGSAHSFLRDLFRLNNIHGDQFFYSPEVLTKYWNLIATDPGSFDPEISPVMGTMRGFFFRNPICFSLEKSEASDYYDLVEFLALERRKPRIASTRVQIRGLTDQDDFIVQEMLGIETHLYDDQMHIPSALGIPQDLSEEGLQLFREDIRRLSGIKASLAFPCFSTPSSCLEFSIGLSDNQHHFTLDGVEVRREGMEELIRVVGIKVFQLAKLAYRDPSRFPQPDLDAIDRQLQELVDKAEKDGLDEAISRDIVIKATILDFYEALAKLTFSMSAELERYLEGSQVVTLTIPRVLLAYLDQALEGRDLEDVLTEGMEGAGR